MALVRRLLAVARHQCALASHSCGSDINVSLRCFDASGLRALSVAATSCTAALGTSSRQPVPAVVQQLQQTSHTLHLDSNSLRKQLAWLAPRLSSSTAAPPGDPPSGSSKAAAADKPPGTEPNVNPAEMLQRVNVLQFRRELEQVAEEHQVVTYDELLDQCQASGAADGRAEADQVCRALLDASVVMRLGGLVYLRPDTVAELVVQALPGTQARVRHKLERLETQLQPLEEQKRRLDLRANRTVKAILWAGLAGFMLQWALFLRLTFWELSWDVMEPVSYFVSTAGSIAVYCYFLYTDSDFSYKPWRTRMASNLQAGHYMRRGFDLERYESLQADVRRLQRLLRRV